MTPRINYPTPEHEQADELLAEIRKARRQFQGLQAAANIEMAAVQLKWAGLLGPLKAREEELNLKLKGLEKTHRAVFFGEAASVKVDLPHGWLLYERSDYVLRRRGVTPEVLEAHGFPGAVRIAKSVDWDQLDDWPDERLLLVGTERKTREEFSYGMEDE